MHPERVETEVTIVGAGPAGLALAVELGTRGVSAVVVEPDPRTRIVPRAKLTNVRSMEHARRWGIAEEIRAASSLAARFTTDVSFVTALDGEEITRFHNVFHTAHVHDPRFPEPAQQIAQFQLEPVLRRRAEEFGCATFLDGARVVGLEQDDHSVRAHVQAGVSGRPMQVRSQYLVSADGARSPTRAMLGIATGGTRGIAHNYGVVFRSRGLRGQIPFAPALHYWIANPIRPSFMGPLDERELWWLQATALPPGLGMRSVDPVAVVSEAIGVDADISIVSTDPWEAHALLADRVRERRCFLIGDAAHVHAPMGAHGMNLAIGDAVDLGWKLGAVLDGWADEPLLDTYAIERGPLHARVLAEATRNYANLPNHFVRDRLGAGDLEGTLLRERVAAEIQSVKRREFSSLGLTLGHGYSGSPAIEGAPEIEPDDDVTVYEPAARAGFRAPHVWLPDGTSLYDRFGEGFTLLIIGTRTGASPLERVAAEKAIPLTTVTIPASAAATNYPQRFALVRPDQMLAWCGDQLPSEPAQLLDRVTARAPRAMIPA